MQINSRRKPPFKLDGVAAAKNPPLYDPSRDQHLQQFFDNLKKKQADLNKQSLRQKNKSQRSINHSSLSSLNQTVLPQVKNNVAQSDIKDYWTGKQRQLSQHTQNSQTHLLRPPRYKMNIGIQKQLQSSLPRVNTEPPQPISQEQLLQFLGSIIDSVENVQNIVQSQLQPTRPQPKLKLAQGQQTDKSYLQQHIFANRTNKKTQTMNKEIRSKSQKEDFNQNTNQVKLRLKTENNESQTTNSRTQKKQTGQLKPLKAKNQEQESSGNLDQQTQNVGDQEQTNSTQYKCKVKLNSDPQSEEYLDDQFEVYEGEKNSNTKSQTNLQQSIFVTPQRKNQQPQAVSNVNKQNILEDNIQLLQQEKNSNSSKIIKAKSDIYDNTDSSKKIFNRISKSFVQEQNTKNGSQKPRNSVTHVQRDDSKNQLNLNDTQKLLVAKSHKTDKNDNTKMNEDLKQQQQQQTNDSQNTEIIQDQQPRKEDNRESAKISRQPSQVDKTDKNDITILNKDLKQQQQQQTNDNQNTEIIQDQQPRKEDNRESAKISRIPSQVDKKDKNDITTMNEDLKQQQQQQTNNNQNTEIIQEQQPSKDRESAKISRQPSQVDKTDKNDNTKMNEDLKQQQTNNNQNTEIIQDQQPRKEDNRESAKTSRQPSQVDKTDKNVITIMNEDLKQQQQQQQSQTNKNYNTEIIQDQQATKEDNRESAKVSRQPSQVDKTDKNDNKNINEDLQQQQQQAENYTILQQQINKDKEVNQNVPTIIEKESNQINVNQTNQEITNVKEQGQQNTIQTDRTILFDKQTIQQDQGQQEELKTITKDQENDIDNRPSSRISQRLKQS